MKSKTFKELIKKITGKGANAVVRTMCGELLGSGQYRDVYVLKLDPDYVVKIERDMSTANFANAMEWRNFIDNLNWGFVSEWLAPCELISQTGQVHLD